MDPFELKLLNEDIYLKETIEEYLNTGVNSNHVYSSTILTYLIISEDIVFDDTELMFILELKKSEKIQNDIYGIIINHIRHVAMEINDFFNPSSLLDIPLTNIKEISYAIAMNFKPIFFVPVKTWHLHRDVELWNYKDTQLINFISKFNEMWIVTLIMNREFKRIQNEQ